MPVVELSPELLDEVPADEELDSPPEVERVPGSTLVEAPSEATAPEELDPPLVSALPAT